MCQLGSASTHRRELVRELHVRPKSLHDPVDAERSITIQSLSARKRRRAVRRIP